MKNYSFHSISTSVHSQATGSSRNLQDLLEQSKAIQRQEKKQKKSYQTNLIFDPKCRGIFEVTYMSKRLSFFPHFSPFTCILLSMNCKRNTASRSLDCFCKFFLKARFSKQPGDQHILISMKWAATIPNFHGIA